MSADPKDTEQIGNSEAEEEHKDESVGLTPLQNSLRKAEIAEFMLTMLKRLKVDHGYRSIAMANAPYDYYSWDLEKRAKFLGAASA